MVGRFCLTVLGAGKVAVACSSDGGKSRPWQPRAGRARDDAFVTTWPDCGNGRIHVPLNGFTMARSWFAVNPTMRRRKAGERGQMTEEDGT
jgi:hypothetical protein